MKITHVVILLALAWAPASKAKAQALASQPLNTSELVPIVVDNGRLDGEAVLSVDISATGHVIKTRLTSGDAALFDPADGVTRMFQHPRLAGSTGVVQHVFFWKKKPGIQKLPPIYPPTAKAAHVSGTVQVIASVAVDGQVSQVTPVSGHPMLVGSAVDSVKQWIYPQVRINGEPEPFHAIIDVNFRLP